VGRATTVRCEQGEKVFCVIGEAGEEGCGGGKRGEVAQAPLGNAVHPPPAAAHWLGCNKRDGATERILCDEATCGGGGRRSEGARDSSRSGGLSNPSRAERLPCEPYAADL
jgi:hypothetical protein